MSIERIGGTGSDGCTCAKQFGGCPVHSKPAADPAQSAAEKYRKQLDEMVEEVCAGYPMLSQKLRASMKFTQFGELIEENEILIGQLKAAETAESALAAQREKTVQECADLVNHLPVSDWCKCGVYKTAVMPDEVAVRTVVFVYEALQRHALTVAAQTPEEK